MRDQTLNYTFSYVPVFITKSSMKDADGWF